MCFLIIWAFLPYIDGNSQKNHLNQPKVLENINEQLRAGETAITGVMIESHINAGKQDVPPESEGGVNKLKYGVSITDACVDWEMTVEMLNGLNEVMEYLLFGHFSHFSPLEGRW